MKAILNKTLEELRAGHRLAWVTILRASGSTPRDAGARMAVLEDGSIVGTVGGGLVELEAIREAGELLRQGRKSLTRSYDLDQGSRSPEGMVCGGRVLLGFQLLDPKDPELPKTLEALSAAVDSPETRWLQCVIGPQDSRLLLRGDADLHSEEARMPSAVTLTEEGDTLILTEPVGRSCMVYLFGGGHVGAALVPVLLPLGFPVTVYDPRPELAREGRYPGASVLLGDFAEISQKVHITARDYVVIMTPEHRADLTVLRQVLKTPAAYIGCIGSRRKTAYVNQTLRAEGWSEAELARVHAPIGLPIHASTPEEIAISIAAEVIRHRAEGN